MVLALVAGCGSGHATARRPHVEAARLTVAYSAGAHRWLLTCGPAGGTHPQPRIACAELAAHAGDLAPVRRPCVVAAPRRTLIRRGAPQSLVTGRAGHRRIDRLLRPPCDAAAWRDLHVLLTGR